MEKKKWFQFQIVILKCHFLKVYVNKVVEVNTKYQLKY